MERVKVLKFGGSSLKDKAGFFNATEVAKRYSPCAVVVSAPGKRYSEDLKVTDLFYDLYQNKGDLRSYSNIFSAISERFFAICVSNKMRKAVLNELDYIFDAVLRSENADYVASRGEYLSAKIFSMYSGYEFLDATKAFEKTSNGIALTNRAKNPVKNGNVVLPGFYYGRYGGGIITLGRGGSDLTGAILARDLNATEYLNFTDVDGVLSAPPSIVNDALKLPKIGYDFLSAMAFFGSDVMQSEAVEVLRNTGVTLKIRHSFMPEHHGTTVSDGTRGNAVAIAVCKKGDYRYERLSKYLGISNSTQDAYLTIISEIGEDLCHKVERALYGVADYKKVGCTPNINIGSACATTYAVSKDDLNIAVNVVHSGVIKNRP